MIEKENEKISSSKAMSLNDDELAKNEIKLVIEPKEKSRKALDHLALVLKEGFRCI